MNRLAKHCSLIIIFCLLITSLPVNLLTARGADIVNPVITSINPNSGKAGVATNIEITGEKFQAGVQVTIGGEPCTNIKFVSSTKITAQTPVLEAIGPKDVIVVNPDGGSTTYTGGFTVISNPAIDDVYVDADGPGVDPKGSTIGGDAITIIGSRFDNINGAKVYIGVNEARNVTVVSPTEIRAITPPGTVGKKSVTVTNADGGSFTAPVESVNAFEYIKSQPHITSIEPAKGSRLGGTSVQITGQEFGEGASVKIGDGYAGNVQVLNSSTITAVTPPGSEGPAPVTVINPDGAATTENITFEYITTPTVSNLTPNNGPTSGGTMVVIKGTNFDTVNGVAVSLGGRPAKVVDENGSETGFPISDTQINILTPSGPPGPAELVVTNNSNPDQTVRVADAFTYTEAQSRPEIKEVDGNPPIEPNTGSTDGGTVITIRGQDFFTGIKVYIDGTPAEDVEIVSTKEIRVKTPPGRAGAKPVRVVNLDGGEFTLADGFTYKIPEKIILIKNVTPPQGSIEGNTPITIKGANFVQPSGDGKVTVELTIGGREVKSFEVVDSQTINAVTPTGGALGPQDVILTVTTVDDTGKTLIERAILFEGFSYIMPLSYPEVVSVINPGTGTNEGPLTGGTEVVITGTGFETGAAVFFGSDEAVDVRVISSTEIRAWTPAVSRPGARDVYVVNEDGGTGVLLQGFFYRGNNLIFTSVTPDRGTVAGNVYATLSGENLSRVYQVDFGEETAQIVEVTPTSIRVLTPKHPAGTVDVTIYDPFGSKTLLKAYTYVIPPSTPVVTQVNTRVGDGYTGPPEGTALGGTPVLIRGDGFQAGAKVLIGSAAATQVEVLSPNEITAVTPPGNTGWADVTVINKDNGKNTLPQGFKYISVPRIDKITPAIGSIQGEVYVTITGSDFHEGARVQFGDTEALSVTFIDRQTLKVKIPAHPPGKVDVVVTNADTGSVTLTGGFEYKIPRTHPVVTGIVPAKGSIDGGTEVKITGEDFRSDAQAFFEGEPLLNVQVISPTELRAVTPPGRLEDVNRPLDVVVINMSDTGYGVLKEGFTYLQPESLPEIKEVFPSEGPLEGGTYLTINGLDFRRNARVFIGGEEAAVVQILTASGEEVLGTDDFTKRGVTIKAITPAHTAGPKDVVVLNEDGAEVRLKNGFTYRIAQSSPGISAVIPNEGRTTGGTPVIVQGREFLPGARLFFGSTPAENVVVLNETTITALTPAGKAGQADVTVINPDSGSYTLRRGFTYLAPPVIEPEIHSLVPAAGSTLGGTQITITGENFLDGVRVFIGEGEATDVVISGGGKLIRALTPPGSSGAKDVVVLNPDGGLDILKNGFTYMETASSPAIAGIEPGQGRVNGGTPLIISGSDFREGAVVYLGGKPANSVEVVSPTKIRAKSPAGEIGKVDVVVQNPDGGSFTLRDGFEYVAVPAVEPSVAKIEPKQGRTSGFTPVTITGAHFDAGAAVYIGGEPATGVVVVNQTTITARTPANSPGKKEVIVINPDNGLGVLPNAFEYIELDAPTVAGVTPGEGPAAGGTRVTIAGTNFDLGARVKIGSEEATGVEVISETEIVAYTPDNELGPQDVTVINPDGSSGTLAGGFVYTGPPRTPQDFDARPVDSHTIKLSWDKTRGIKYFEIYGKESGDDDYVFVARTEKTEYYVTDLEEDTRYYFKLRAVNQFGESAFTSYDDAETYQDTDDDDDEDGDNRIELKPQILGNKVSVTVAKSNMPARRSGYYYIDLTDDIYQKVGVKVININAEVIADYSGSFKIKLPGLTLRLNTYLFREQLSHLSSKERRSSYGRLIITPAAGRELEVAQRSLPKGMKVVSEAFDLDGEVQIGKKTEKLTDFDRDIDLTIAVQQAEFEDFYNSSLAVNWFDPRNRKWVALDSGMNPYDKEVSANISGPGLYLAAARKK